MKKEQRAPSMAFHRVPPSGPTRASRSLSPLAKQLSLFLGLSLAAVAVPQQLHAGNVSKANNTGALNLGTSWVGGVAPANT
ncbi:MAG TPA: hypothetical protein VHI52_12365, partial [Verrucomicrobiae bacterium]|nr:hypothetical protein [Verrucomicrobiae bacterium]